SSTGSERPRWRTTSRLMGSFCPPTSIIKGRTGAVQARRSLFRCRVDRTPLLRPALFRHRGTAPRTATTQETDAWTAKGSEMRKNRSARLSGCHTQSSPRGTALAALRTLVSGTVRQGSPRVAKKSGRKDGRGGSAGTDGARGQVVVRAPGKVTSTDG